MKFGVSYYPELTPEVEWEGDLDRMLSHGITTVRILDFAWSALEPEEGRLEVTWLDRFIGLCERKKISVVLCIPTAAPPQWLMSQYPEMMIERRDGTRLTYGERRACCVNNTIYRDFSVGIAEALAKRYGHTPCVVGWQVDNELIGPEYRDIFECHCPECVWRFRKWLKARYASVQEINESWGLRFWSMEFRDWGEVVTPRCHRACLGHTLDFHRFYNDSTADFLGLLRDAIKRHASPNQFVSHNSTAIFDRGIDHKSFAEKIDCSGWDAYPGAASADHGPSSLGTALANDMFRAYKRKPFLIFETSPQKSAVNVAYMAEMAARGAEEVMFWLWRTHRANLEQASPSFCGFDGQPVTGALERLDAVRAELATLEAEIREGCPVEEQRPTAFLFDVDNVRLEHRKPHRPMPYLTSVMRMTLPTWKHGVLTDVVSPNAPLDGYKMVVMPALKMMSDEQAKSIQEFVASGGILAACGCTAQMDSHGVYRRKIGSPLADVIGATAEYCEDDFSSMEAEFPDGTRYRIDSKQGELLHPFAETKTLAIFQGGFANGAPALIEHAYGKGRVFYCASQGSAGLFERLIQAACKAAGIRFYENPFDDVGLIPLKNSSRVCIVNTGNSVRTIAHQTIPPNGAILADIPSSIKEVGNQDC